MQQVNIYLYESSKALKLKEAKYYYKMTCKTHHREGWGRVPEATTAHQLVMKAAIAAFQCMRHPAVITVHTDCSYLATYHKYAQKWKQNDWKKEDGQEVRNKELWEELLHLEAPHAVSYRFHRRMPDKEET